MGRLGPRRITRSVAALYAAALLAAVACEVVVVELSSTPDVDASVTAVVPSGACSVSDNPSILVTADRFVSAVPGLAPRSLIPSAPNCASPPTRRRAWTPSGRP